MKPRLHAVRMVFATSVLLSAFWILGLLSETALEHDLPLQVLVPIAIGVALAICIFSLRKGHMKLHPSRSIASVVRAIAPKVALSYLILTVAVGLLVWATLRWVSATPDHPENGVVIGLLALWLPLWLAPAAAAEWWWRSERQHTAHDA
jgi:hypothetical protein